MSGVFCWREDARLDARVELFIMRGMAQARIILRIDISPGAAKRLGAITERFGCTQVTMLSKLVEWYAQLPADLRADITRSSGKDRGTDRAIVKHLIGK